MNRYTAVILGGIWWPIGLECSLQVDFWADSDEEAIEAAQTTEAGDFSSVRDVFVLGESGRLVKDWDNEENELAYFDTLPSED